MSAEPLPANPSAPQDEQRAIEQLFAYPSLVPLPDPRQPSDPVITEMVRLAALPSRERDEALEPYLTGWLEQNRSRLDIAAYLALAGLTLPEAEALVALLRARVRLELARQARRWLLWGLFLCAASLGALFLRQYPLWSLLLVAGMAMGLSCVGRAVRIINRITPPPDERLS